MYLVILLPPNLILVTCPDFRPLALVARDPQVAGDQTLWTTTPFNEPIRFLQASYLVED